MIVVGAVRGPGRDGVRVSGAASVLEGELLAYRRQWRGSVVSTFVNPVLFLSAMGLGLGALVDGTDRLGGLSYLSFYASGLLAAQAMQTGASDGGFPVMAGLKWVKTYFLVVATPATPRDLVVGHLGFVALRLAASGLVFATTAALFGAFALHRGWAAVPVVVLCGLAYAATVMAVTATWRNDQALVSVFRFGLVPMFLLSGTFFPVTQLPQWLQPVARAVPLWHAVEVVRAVTVAAPTAWPAWLHVTYLGAWFAVGAVLSAIVLGRRLVG